MIDNQFIMAYATTRINGSINYTVARSNGISLLFRPINLETIANFEITDPYIGRMLLVDSSKEFVEFPKSYISDSGNVKID